MSIFEYNDERQAKLFRQEGIEYGRMQMMAEMISRTMKEKGISFKEACAALLLSDEEIAACKEFMDQMNSKNGTDQEV